MQKTNRYALILKQKPEADWDAYLMSESGLPGPRANLELAHAAADAGSLDQFNRWLAFGPDAAGGNTPEVFLPVCAAIGLGRLLAEGQGDLLERLHGLAADPRWRMREAVAMALQRLGARDMAALLAGVQPWVEDGLLEMRAVAAGVCEPVLLAEPAHARRVLDLLARITQRLAAWPERRTEEFRVLRQALGYCWSVAIAACPAEGKAHLERLAASADSDVCWIVRENLKKNRLARMDSAWVERMQLSAG